MRIATYNVEWFDRLFDDAGQLLDDEVWSSRYNVTRGAQLTALGMVFTALDADAILVIEAPDQNGHRDCVRALENFAHYFGLRTRKAVIGFASDTQQEIALLYDPDVLHVWHEPEGEPTGKKGSDDAPRFDGVFRIDLDIDATEDLVTFSKPPLELRARSADGCEFRLIGAHLKSKSPRGARDRDAVMRLSVANRRKQLAQAIWLRRRIERQLENGMPLILLGDLNDGPGLDEYENLFGRSSVEIIMGKPEGERLFDPHAQHVLQNRWSQLATARFYIAPEKRYLQALLDYIFVSSALRAVGPKWRIWHPFDDDGCLSVPELREALLTASDHFPVTIDFDTALVDTNNLQTG